MRFFCLSVILDAVGKHSGCFMVDFNQIIEWLSQHIRDIE